MWPWSQCLQCITDRVFLLNIEHSHQNSYINIHSPPVIDITAPRSNVNNWKTHLLASLLMIRLICLCVNRFLHHWFTLQAATNDLTFIMSLPWLFRQQPKILTDNCLICQSMKGMGTRTGCDATNCDRDVRNGILEVSADSVSLIESFSWTLNILIKTVISTSTVRLW